MSVDSYTYTPKPGEVLRVGSKLYVLCSACRCLVRLNKPLIGDWHICVEAES